MRTADLAGGEILGSISGLFSSGT